MYDENKILIAIAEGSESAMKKLYDLYKIKVYNSAISYTQNVKDAEEILQDVFISISVLKNYAHEKGVITFFELANVDEVSEDLPPLVDFYRYAGEFGVSVTTSTSAHFNGGDGSCGDGAVAICIDNTRFSSLGASLGEGDCSHAFQIGPHGCGSWRMVVVGNGDGSTSLHFQYRTGTTDQWRTKMHIDPLDCDPTC